MLQKQKSSKQSSRTSEIIAHGCWKFSTVFRPNHFLPQLVCHEIYYSGVCPQRIQSTSNKGLRCREIESLCSVLYSTGTRDVINLLRSTCDIWQALKSKTSSSTPNVDFGVLIFLQRKKAKKTQNDFILIQSKVCHAQFRMSFY